MPKRNRRATSHRSHLYLIPLSKLFPGKDDILVYTHLSVEEPDAATQQRRAGQDPHWKIPVAAWPTVLARIGAGEPLRKVASDYGVSHEAVRRVIRAARKEQAG